MPSDPNLWVKKEDLPLGRYEVLGVSIYKLKRFLHYDKPDFIIHLKHRETKEIFQVALEDAEVVEKPCGLNSMVGKDFVVEYDEEDEMKCGSFED